MNPSQSLSLLRGSSLLQRNPPLRLIIFRSYASNDNSPNSNNSSSSSSSLPKISKPELLNTNVVQKTPSKLSQALMKRPWAARTVQTLGRLFQYDDLRLGAIKASGLHFEVCADQWVNDEFWISECGLPDTFQTWFKITMLHAYLLIVRYRALPPEIGQAFAQEIVNHIFIDAERRMKINYDISSGSIVKRYMREFLFQYHGSVSSYDEGLIEGDAVLAAAIWRNIFGCGWGYVGGLEKYDPKIQAKLSTSRTIDTSTPRSIINEESRFPPHLERIVTYIRREVNRLEKLTDEEIMNTQIYQLSDKSKSPVNFSKV